MTKGLKKGSNCYFKAEAEQLMTLACGLDALGNESKALCIASTISGTQAPDDEGEKQHRTTRWKLQFFAGRKIEFHRHRSPGEMMTEDNEYYAYFTIIDSFNPADITKRAGVEPTEAWRKGDLHPKSRKERKFSRWSLYSRLNRTCELEEHVRDVLEQLDANAEAFKTISQEFDGYIQLVGYFNLQYPGLHFDQRIIEGLAKYKLCVDFDFYYLYSDVREDT